MIVRAIIRQLAGHSTDADQAARLLRHARDRASKGQLTAALALYQRVCTLDALDPEPWTERADIAAILERAEEAAQCYFQVADLYLRSGFVVRGGQMAERALAASPRHPGARRLASWCRARLNAWTPELVEVGPAAPAGEPPLLTGQDTLPTAGGLLAALLFESAFLSTLNSDLLRLIIRGARLRRVQAGEAVIAQSELDASVFLAVSGHFWVEVAEAETTRRLATLAAGDVFGEVAALLGGPRSATVRAASDGVVLEIPQELVRTIDATSPATLELLKQYCVDRLARGLLALSPLFESIRGEDRAELASHFRLRALIAGEIALEPGQRAPGLLLVVSGTLVSGSESGEQGRLLGSGDVLGAASLLEGTLVPVCVRARTEARVLVLPRSDFHRLASAEPVFLERVAELGSRA